MTTAAIPDELLRSPIKAPSAHGRGFLVVATSPVECPTCGTARAFFVLTQHIGWAESGWTYKCALCDGEMR